MRTPKKLRHVRMAPVALYTYGGGLTVAVYAGYPESPGNRLGIGDTARTWRKGVSYGRRVVISRNGKNIETGRCPRCGQVTNGSGDILTGLDAGDREHTYCPPCLVKQVEEDRTGKVWRHGLRNRK